MTRFARYRKTFNHKKITDLSGRSDGPGEEQGKNNSSDVIADGDLTAEEKHQISQDKNQSIEALRQSKNPRPNLKSQRCLGCRQIGHSLSACPKKSNSRSICYNCGSNAHALRHCPLPREDTLPFASCFICNEKGHLSGSCPSNDRGIYPNGGGCRHCGSNKHLARDCRPASSAASPDAMRLIIGTAGTADDDITFSALRSIQDEQLSRKRPKKAGISKIVKF